MSELGDKFNIKDFHSAVLDHGNPPLFIVEEMVNMIETQRAYEINSKAISAADGMLRFLNNNL